MPKEIERHAAVLKKLQKAIQGKSLDPTVVAGRRLAIKRWVKTYTRNIEYLEDNKLKFLCNVFQDEGDESCWSGTRLNNTALGKKLTEEKIGDTDNPLRKYDMACRYCVVDKIHSLFQEQFESYKYSFSPNAVDGDGNPVSKTYIRNSLLNGMKREDPAFIFWIDRESGELRHSNNAEEGFDSAVKLKWSEGVEYFYNQLEEKDKEKKLTEAIIALSHVQSVEKDTPILDFCVNNIADKDTLLQKLSQKDKGAYSLFAQLIDSCFFDTVHGLVECWCYEEVAVTADKIFSQQDYELLLSSLSDVMLKNPESSAQARSVIMKIWECDSLDEYKKTAIIDTSNGRIPIKGVLARLIVNWKRGGCKSDEKKEISDMILFAKNSFPERFEFFKGRIIKSLRLCSREGMEESINYDDLAKELFSELEETTSPPGPGGDGPRYDLRTQSQVHGSKKTSLPLDGSGDGPQSKFEAPSMSGVSSRRK